MRLYMHPLAMTRRPVRLRRVNAHMYSFRSARAQQTLVTRCFEATEWP